MGFMDKVKAQAEQLQAKASAGMQQGQTKLDAIQAKRQGDALLRDLGAAFYAEQRTGGTREAVASALAAVDGHSAQHGPIDTTASTPPAAGSATAGPTGSTDGPAPPTAASGAPPAQPAAPGSGTPGGNFSLDDL